jgi:hypothetical protein
METANVNQIAVLATIAHLLSTANAEAETFRCIMDRQITVRAFGEMVDNRDENKGREFYLAIDNKTQKGTYSTCTQPAGCSNVAEIPIVTRYKSEGLPKGTKNLMIRLITGATGQLGQLWSLERWGGDREFTAIAVSAQGQRSDTTLGTCQMIIQ